MSNTVEQTVRQVMNKYGIPDYIWYPIARAESGFNPFAINPDGELSKGIFQINVKAHPEYADMDLYDPEVNADLAARRFIAPAYEYAKQQTSDPLQQALIVYSGLKDPQTGPKGGYIPGNAGIRPRWSSELMDRFTGYFNEYVSGSGSIGSGGPFTGSGSMSGSASMAGSASMSGSGKINLTGTQSAVRFMILIGLIIAGIIAVFSLLKDAPIVQTIKQGAKAAATHGLSEI